MFLPYMHLNWMSCYSSHSSSVPFPRLLPLKLCSRKGKRHALKTKAHNVASSCHPSLPSMSCSHSQLCIFSHTASLLPSAHVSANTCHSHSSSGPALVVQPSDAFVPLMMSTPPFSSYHILKYENTWVLLVPVVLLLAHHVLCLTSLFFLLFPHSLFV